MSNPEGINRQFEADPRLRQALGQSQSDRDHAAFESLVKESMQTARQMGNVNVTEEQVRRDLAGICGTADAKREAGAYKNAAPSTAKAVPDEIVIDENPNLKEV